MRRLESGGGVSSRRIALRACVKLVLRLPSALIPAVRDCCHHLQPACEEPRDAPAHSCRGDSTLRPAGPPRTALPRLGAGRLAVTVAKVSSSLSSLLAFKSCLSFPM